ncbi:hypothetical protein BT93_A1538 [Corymbia citriodora subsp. variegata]|nr:hypothetical protein BT93_A1538 [Corymbia citriodora subsp. variegata]
MPILVHWFRQASFKRDHLYDAGLNASANIPDDNALVLVEASTKYFALFLIPPTLRSLTSFSFLSINRYTSFQLMNDLDTWLIPSLLTRAGKTMVLLYHCPSLSGNHTLISSGSNFKLGFFTPGNSMYSYIGIWYNKINVQTVIWVTNRQPVTDRYSTELKILGGNLVIINDSAVPVWSTNLTASSSGSSPTVAFLDGNFALKDGPNSSVTLWQSFDHPTHTCLPALLEHWGVGNRTKFFSLVPEMRMNYIYDFEYMDNENESYFTYSVYNAANTISRFVMDLSGQNKMLSWLPSSQEWNLFWSQPRQQCEVYGLCGAFGVCSDSTDNFCSCLRGDWSGGCKRNSALNCVANASNAEKDSFLLRSNMKLPESPQSLNVGSDQECRAACLNSCSFTAYAFKDNNCSIWIGDLFYAQQLTLGDSTASSFYLRLAASDVEDPSKKSNVTVIVSGSVSAAVAILAIVLFGIWRWRRRPTVTTKTVEVFRGTLPDSSHTAVKKLESISQGEKQFRTEVSTIGTIQHLNLVRFRWFCSEGDKRLLVYDFMPNGSLDWKTGYQITLGTARGLAYYHEKCRDYIIHCDIKPENILLDAEFCPKVADFGLAKLVGRDFSRVLTTMRGTRGYLAPQWISGVAITAKADVYSYGMMLFEFVSGRRNSELSENGAIEFFPTWAASKIADGGDLLDLLDPNLEANANTEGLTRSCLLVVQILEGVLDVNLSQIPRALRLFLDSQEHVVFFTELSLSNQSSQVKSNTSTASLQNQNSSAPTKSKS